MRQDERERLIYHAKKVLEFNWTGEYTQPGPRLYPHQWSWDSALVAIGYARYDQDRAEKELTGRGVLVRALTACEVAKVPSPTLEAAVRRNPLVATKLMTLQDARLTRHEEFLARVWTRKTRPDSREPSCISRSVSPNGTDARVGRSPRSAPHPRGSGRDGRLQPRVGGCGHGRAEEAGDHRGSTRYRHGADR